MKKSIIILSMLGFGLIYAQQDNNGKVGVNTQAPNATLDIKPTKENEASNSNEGLLVPRLSKARVASMKTPETSTLVYINEVSYTAGKDTGADTRVEKVDAAGFYHYNGTQWVKHIDTNTDEGSKWTNDNKSRVVKLTNLSDGKTEREDNKNVFVSNNGFFGIGTVPVSQIHTRYIGEEGRSAGYSNDIQFEYYENDAPKQDPVSIFIRRYGGSPSDRKNIIENTQIGNIGFTGQIGGTHKVVSTINSYYIGDGTSLVGKLNFGTSGRSADMSLNNGRLGIGTETPEEKLDVKGVAQAYSVRGVLASDAGPWFELYNPLKNNIAELSGKWRIYNATEGESYKYVPGLHFWAYQTDDEGSIATNLGSKMVLTDKGNLNIGFPSSTLADVRLKATEEKLEVNGNIKSHQNIIANNGIFIKLPVYADDAAADADTNLPSGSLYKLKNTGRQVFVKP